MARKNREKGGADENVVAVAGEELRKQTEEGDGEPRGTPEERAGVEADALIAGVPMSQPLSQDALEEALRRAEEVAPEPGPPPKRKPIISVMGTDKATGERSILCRARSLRAARKWVEQARFLLSRLYTNLTVAVAREEDL